MCSGFNRPAEHGGQVFLAVIGRTGLAFLGLQIAQPLYFLAGDEWQRAVTQRLRVVVCVRLGQAAIDDLAPRYLGYRVEPSEFVGGVVFERQPAQRALGGGNRRGTAIGWRWLRQNFQRRSIGFRKGLRAGLFLDPDAATVAPDIEVLIAMPVGLGTQEREIELHGGHASASSHLEAGWSVWLGGESLGTSAGALSPPSCTMTVPSDLIPVTRRPTWRAARTARLTEACVKGRVRVIEAVPVGSTACLEAVVCALLGAARVSLWRG
jgi:hypothetical protein